jgi:ketosteroid isomerase-like protein
MSQTTNEVWTHHIEAWQARSLDAIVSDYNEDSVLILNNQVFKGTRAIKNVFAQLFGIFDHGQNRIDTPVLSGRIVYITWHFTPTGESEFFGTDTFVIEQGKIAVQTIASPLYDRSENAIKY